MVMLSCKVQHIVSYKVGTPHEIRYAWAYCYKIRVRKPLDIIPSMCYPCIGAPSLLLLSASSGSMPAHKVPLYTSSTKVQPSLPLSETNRAQGTNLHLQCLPKDYDGTDGNVLDVMCDLAAVNKIRKKRLSTWEQVPDMGLKSQRLM